MINRVKCWLAGSLLLLAACNSSESLQYRLSSYVAALNLSSAPVAADLAPWPESHRLKLSVADIKVNLRQFMTLHRCGIGPLVGERNSALGLSAGDPARMLYEYRLLNLLVFCRNSGLDGDDPSLQLLLAGAIEDKRAVGAAILWNGIFASREFAQGFAAGAPPLALDTGDDIRPPVAALSMWRLVVESWGLGASVVGQKDFWRAYQVLEQQQYGGRLLSSLALLAPGLEAANSGLTRFLENCPQSAVQVARARKQWQSDLAVYSAGVYSRGRQFISHLEKLLSLQQALLIDAQQQPGPALLRDWFDSQLSPANASSLWRRFVAARGQHRALWLALDERCPVAAR